MDSPPPPHAADVPKAFLKRCHHHATAAELQFVETMGRAGAGAWALGEEAAAALALKTELKVGALGVSLIEDQVHSLQNGNKARPASDQEDTSCRPRHAARQHPLQAQVCASDGAWPVAGGARQQRRPSARSCRQHRYRPKHIPAQLVCCPLHRPLLGSHAHLRRRALARALHTAHSSATPSTSMASRTLPLSLY
jgi:hypothetical protein